MGPIGSIRWPRALRRLFPETAAGQSPAPTWGPDAAGQSINALDGQDLATPCQQHWRAVSIGILLFVAVGLVFGQTARYGFVNYDDHVYVCENPHIARGLSFQGIVWVFTHSHASNWHPATGLTHMLDCQLYGIEAGGHHLTNVLLHAATSILLFLVLWKMTSDFWPSALVAALFAVHPLRVESVTWVSERKDVLSGLFFVLTLAAYLRYVRRPFSVARYLSVVALLAVGLMAKPMLVTLPLVLLLLDYWPLRRFAGNSWRRFAYLVVEKLPLLLLTALSCMATVWAQGEAVVPVERLPFWWRASNALVSYVAYLAQLCCPLGLAAFYPHPGVNLPMGKVMASAVILAAISAAAVAGWRRRPYLLVGWLWYVGMLVPAIGLLQAGPQARADRYTYLPQIGLCLAFTWAVAELFRRWPLRQWAYGIASASLLAVLIGSAWRQTSFWRDSVILWTHTLDCTTRNDVAHCNLGGALIDAKRIGEAIDQCRKALTIKPDYAQAHHFLGDALADLGRLDEAVTQQEKALEIKPRYVQVHCDLGVALARLGRFDEAMAHYRKALEIQPDFPEAHYDVGNLLAGRGQLDEAVAQYQLALEDDPDYAPAHNNLGAALTRLGRLDEALAHYQRALELQPDYAMAYANLGAALTRAGRLDEALVQYRKVLELKPGYAMAHYNLGNVLAGRGQFEQALAQYQQALQIQPDYAVAHYQLAWLRATCPLASLRNGAEAIEHASQANQLCEGKRPEILDALAAAYAEAGWFPEALATIFKAVELAERQHNPAFASMLRKRITLYQARRPFHETLPAFALPRPQP